MLGSGHSRGGGQAHSMHIADPAVFTASTYPWKGLVIQLGTPFGLRHAKKRSAGRLGRKKYSPPAKRT